MDERSRDWVGPVQHNQRQLRRGTGFKKISKRRFVGIPAHARVLNIEDHGVKSLQDLWRRAPGSVRGAIDAVDAHAGRLVTRLINLRRIERAADAVLGAENRTQFNIRHTSQQVYAAPALRVDPGLVRHQPDPAWTRRATWRAPWQVLSACRTGLSGDRGGKQRSTTGQHVKSGLHLSIARLQQALQNRIEGAKIRRRLGPDR